MGRVFGCVCKGVVSVWHLMRGDMCVGGWGAHVVLPMERLSLCSS